MEPNQKRKFFMILLMTLYIIVAALPSLANDTAEYAGIVFKQLSEEDLDVMQQQTGYRLGVEVVTVKKGSPAVGILTPGSVVMAVGKDYVDVPEAAVEALQNVSGKVAVVALINVNGKFVAKTVELNLSFVSSGTKPTKTNPPSLTNNTNPKTGTNETSSKISSTNDLVVAYFDLLDFMRTQAWGRSSVTPAAERQRVAYILQGAWSQMDRQSQAGSLQIADMWFNLKKEWPKMTPAKQNELRGYWRNFLLMPTMLYPPLNQPQTYNNGSGSFQYPDGWTGGQTEANGYGYLFIGPGGSNYSWQQVLNTATSPAGSFFMAAPLTSDLRSYTALQGARIYEQQFFANAPGFKEIYANESAMGAIVIVKGKFPGQAEEKFFWITIIPMGNQYVVCRMGGPVAQSDKLVPAYWNMLSSIQFKQTKSSSSGGTGEAYGSWEVAWSKVSCAAVSNIWAPSGN